MYYKTSYSTRILYFIFSIHVVRYDFRTCVNVRRCFHTSSSQGDSRIDHLAAIPLFHTLLLCYECILHFIWNPQSCLHFPSVLHTFSFYIIKIRILLYTIPRICPVSRSPPLVQVFVCQLFRLERKLVELLLFLLLSVLPLEKICFYNLP